MQFALTPLLAALSTEMHEQAGILAPLPRKVIPEFAIDNTLRAQQLDLYCKTLSADLSAEEVSFTSLDSYVSLHAFVRLFTRILKSPDIPPTITASWPNPYRCANLLHRALIEPIKALLRLYKEEHTHLDCTTSAHLNRVLIVP